MGITAVVRRISLAVSLILVVALPTTVMSTAVNAAAPPAGCVDDDFPFFTPTGPAQARVCVTTPTAGPVSGTVTVTATLANVGQPTSPKSQFAARRMEFTLDGQSLLTDYQAEPRATLDEPAVYTFQLPTTKWVDGLHQLSVHAVMGDTLKGPYPAQTPAPGEVTLDVVVALTFSNGITVVPPNTNRFTPTSGTQPGPGRPFVLAATGDSAGGEPEADAVIDQVASWNPNLFLYLGDVYEDGTFTEFYNWYGTGGQHWSRFRPITNPTVGNHEYANGVAPGYFDYWDNVPDYYSFNAHGWHFVSLNSNVPIGQQPGSPQYEWLKADLAANTTPCTIAFFHHPLFNIGAQGSTTRMSAIWSLLATAGADIVLTGHDHNYQRWQPMDAAGSPAPTGLTEFVAGAGGHGVRPFTSSDPRVVVGFDTTPSALGALRFELLSDRAAFSYINSSGTTLDSGQILCEPSPYEADSPRHELYVTRADLRQLLTTGSAPAAKLTSAIGHLDKAAADPMWVSDWRPIADHGEIVIDEMKKAVDDLRTIAGSNPVLPDLINRLALAGQHLAEAAIAEATSAYGPLDLTGQARTLLRDGLQRAGSGDFVGALDKYKQSFATARDALANAPAGWTPGVGTRGLIGDQLSALYARYPTGVGSTDTRLKDAVNELGKALDRSLWADEVSALKKDVFDRMKAAEAKLMGISAPDMSGPERAIASIARKLATEEIAAAVARNGSPSSIQKARDKLAEADAKVAQGKYNEAMDRFRDSWLSARDA